MELSSIQQFLKDKSYYSGIADNKTGPLTQSAVNKFLTDNKIEFSKWTDSRRLIAVEQLIYKAAGLEIGLIDGLVGPQTTFIREDYEAIIKTGSAPRPWRDEAEKKPLFKVEPKSSSFPRQKDVLKFYGDVGKNQTSLILPYSMKLAWDKSQTVSKISIHEKCHDSALSAFSKIKSAYSPEDISKHGFDLFGGSLNVRKMRGGTAWSMHSWGIAIDFDPERNQLKWDHNKAYLDNEPCVEFWKIWESVGWLSLGRARDYDWMHVQAAML